MIYSISNCECIICALELKWSDIERSINKNRIGATQIHFGISYVNIYLVEIVLVNVEKIMNVWRKN